MVRTDLGIDETGSSRSYDEGGMENDGEGHDIVSMESLIQGHFDEDRAMTRAERDAIAVESAMNASDARGWDVYVLPGDSHVTAMVAIKDEFGLRTSTTTTPGLLRVMFVAIASPLSLVETTSATHIYSLGSVPPQWHRNKDRGNDDTYDVEKTMMKMTEGCRQCRQCFTKKTQCPWVHSLGLDKVLSPA